MCFVLLSFSYGTVLGITFASMCPDNIERMILDGVADTEAWYIGEPFRYSLSWSQAHEIQATTPP